MGDVMACVCVYCFDSYDVIFQFHNEECVLVAVIVYFFCV